MNSSMKKLLLISVSCILSLNASEIEQTQVTWDDTLPVSYIDIKETKNCVETGHPVPHSTGSSFSRNPYPAYINQENGEMIIEYNLPRLSQDGPSTFVIESCCVSSDGMELTVHRQMFFAPSEGIEKSSFIYKVKTTKPYQFSVNGKFYVFDICDSKILSCNVFKLKRGQDKPSFLRQIYPTNVWVYGIFSPV